MHAPATPAVAALAAALCLGMAACGFRSEKLLTAYERLEVQEVRRSLQCGSPPGEPRAQLFPDAAAVQAWQAGRGIDLVGARPLADLPHALIELGSRPTGGYGLAASRAAVLRGELLILQATFVSPVAGAMTTQALTAPCVLVQLPAGRYRDVEVQDQNGAIRATGSTAMPDPSPAPETPAQ